MTVGSVVAVTGATGHIGNNLVRALNARGVTVRCLVLPSESLRPLAGLDVEVREGDVRDPESLVRAFTGAEVVYHLASIVTVAPGRSRLLYDVNVRGTGNVVNACLKCGVSRLVYTSSVHALVEPPLGCVIDERLPFDPARIKSPYGKSKAMATLEVLRGVEKGLDAVIVSPSGVIGPYDFGPSQVGRVFLGFARGRVRAYVRGAYDFVDVRDVAAGLMAACARGRTGENYLLSGEQITVGEVMRVLAEATGRPAPRFVLPGWVAEVAAAFASAYGVLARAREPWFTTESLYVLRSNSLVSHEKAIRELGHNPRPIRQSIVDTVEWFRKAGMLSASRGVKRPGLTPAGC